jgi:small subunit ribosomal protein S3
LGQKVHPIGFRLGVVKGWQSRWYAERNYKDIFAEDDRIRKAIKKELFNASISRIEIERAAANQVSVAIYTAKPGIVIGKSGEKVDKLRAMLEKETKKRVRLNILEIRQPELDAYLVARSIAEQLEKRVSFRRAMKQAVQKAMKSGAKGVKIIVGGRLGGAEIARSEKEVEGKIPLHTLRADIDYGFAEANTTFGVIGIKVWIYKGDILPDKRRETLTAQQEVITQPGFAPREREGGERRGGERRRSGERGERAGRPQGERQGGDRGPRQAGERPSRPQGERAERGERPPRQPGERPPRPQGERPQGERPPRQPRPQGERPPRAPGERTERAERGERPPRQPGERPPRGQHAPAAPAAQPTPQATETTGTPAPATTPAPPTEIPAPEAPASDTETGTTQSE